MTKTDKLSGTSKAFYKEVCDYNVEEGGYCEGTTECEVVRVKVWLYLTCTNLQCLNGWRGAAYIRG